MADASLKPYSVFSFTRGLDLKTSALKLALLKGQDALVHAQNTVYTAAGAVSKRLDAALLNPSPVDALSTASSFLMLGLGDFVTGNDAPYFQTLGLLASGSTGTTITGGIEFVKSNGDRIVVVGTSTGKRYTVSPTGAGTEIQTGLTTGTKHYFESYNDKLIMCNRSNAPSKFDGTTVSALGGSPPTKGGPVKKHGNRIFFLDGDEPSDIVWSALDAEEDYTTATNAGRASISPNDGSDMIDMVPSINELVLLKGARPYRLQGTSPSTFTIANVVPTTGSVGAISTQGAIFAVNQVWYAARSGLVSLVGVQQFGDLRESFASDKIRPYWEPGSAVQLSINRLVDAVVAYDPQWNRIYQSVDTDNDGQNDTLLVYDLTTKGWSVWDGIGVASMWPVLNTDSGITEMWAGGYDGRIRVLNRPAAEEATEWRVSHLSCLDSPGVEKSLRHIFMYFKEGGNHLVDVTVKTDFGGGGQVYQASLLGASHTLGVNWVLGVDPLGTRSQIVKRIDTHTTGEFFEIEVANNDVGAYPVWYGFETLARNRRVVRRGTAGVSV
jgi:hypothetical protein